MALEINKKRAIFSLRQIWFAEYPFDVKGADRVIFKDCKNKIDAPGFSREETTTLVIDLAQDLDSIWKNMSRTSCRYEIHRAEKEGIKVKINQNFEDYIKIDKLFSKAKKRRSLNLTREFLKKSGILFVAELNGEILGGYFYLRDDYNMEPLSNPSKRLNVDNKKSSLVGMGNRLIIWEAIKYAKEKGIKEYDFGGYYTGEEKDEQKEKINMFKRSFGGKLVTRYNYRKDYSIIYKLFSFIKQKICLK
jgi:hypothetical protein